MGRAMLRSIVVGIVFQVVMQPVVLPVRYRISVGILVVLVSMKTPMFQVVMETTMISVTGLSRSRFQQSQRAHSNQS